MATPREITAAAALLLCLTAAGAEPVKLPRDLAALLSAAQADMRDGRTDEAIALLEAFGGKDHALRHLLLGHAYLQREDLAKAAGAYRRALAMDGKLEQAGLSLADVCARQENWPEAAKLLGRFVAVDACDVDVLLLYARVARQMNDNRLCGLLVRKGILRFPDEVRFRRLDLILLLDEADDASAARTAMLLLKRTPTDAALWQQLAFTHQRSERDTRMLAALEASLLCDEADLDKHRQFLAAQLAVGDWLTALEHGQALLAGPLSKSASADTRTMELLIHAADVGRRDKALAEWLKRVPDASRTRPMRLAAARMALRGGDTPTARQALEKVIAAGETDPSVFLWAGHLAEQAGDPTRAEALYNHARKLTGDAARLATLYLARLNVTGGQQAAAVRLLKQYLNSYPEDVVARAMLAQAERRMQNPESR